MIGVVLQARLDSSRLPAKALLDLQGKTVVQHAMAALRRVSAAERFILATDPGSAEFFRQKAEAEGFELFIGPKEDVLRRYADAARHYGLELVIRATGDNPLVSWEIAEETLSLQRAGGADYAVCTESPLGTGVEVIAVPALLTADTYAEDPYEREHVCPFLYRRPGEFTISTAPVRESRRCPTERVTLDTLDDYRYIAGLFRELYGGTPVGIDRLIAYFNERSSSDTGNGAKNT
ncbi:cytidylyltransferase domain-containing protein [Marispirochaeta sp.]|uniref:cytidylyltransferase domain-containing protein n=1 Tax=Marispirochaeta sp. TaxID=2038653 RepID=UPI0029C84D45|nr:NTP transferase domain-containing protein [Marispirochaeta sp.]